MSLYRVRPNHANDLYNHLGDTMTTQCLTADKRLALDTRKGIADGRQQQEHGRCDQLRGRGRNAAHELDDGHDKVGGSARIVGRDSADKGVELAGGRADAQEEGDFDEENQQGGRTVAGVSETTKKGCVATYMPKAPMMMTSTRKLSRAVIPVARAMIMDRRPSLCFR